MMKTCHCAPKKDEKIEKVRYPPTDPASSYNLGDFRMSSSKTIEQILFALPIIKEYHARTSALYPIFEKAAKNEVERLFCDSSTEKKVFGPFGELVFPYFKMGAIDSLDLFGLDELILFSFYWTNRARYKKTLDIGANIGLHTTLMARCGFEVRLFEPDPVHFAKLQETIALNEVQGIISHQAAVSSRSGEAEFVRVIGNTTSSHLAGCKQPYGDVERFSVPLFDIREIMRSVDLIKMDVEGHEDQIILATKSEDWQHTDALVEVGAADKAEQIFKHLRQIGVRLFAQKKGWLEVDHLEEMPTSYKDGSLFISTKAAMPWGQ